MFKVSPVPFFSSRERRLLWSVLLQVKKATAELSDEKYGAVLNSSSAQGQSTTAQRLSGEKEMESVPPRLASTPSEVLSSPSINLECCFSQQMLQS